jgi:hypothetical protein
MQASDLLNYIENPALLDKGSVKDLQKLANDFPYFQSAHILLSMAAKKWDASVYQQSLKKTAIVASNRAHLFELIHKIENSEFTGTHTEWETKVVAANAKERKEETQQELSILKATKILTEPLLEAIKAEQKTVLSPEEILEKEIQNQVVNSFVETEILKTPDFDKPISVTAPPESFTEWLSLMKKNNGQSIEQREEQLSASRLKKEIKGQKTLAQEPEKTNNTTEKVEKNSLEARKQKNKAIIDKIIEKSPGLIRQKEEQKFYTPDIKAKESLIENEHLVTETLARIYALQGNINKAIRAYEILSLKFPQKSAYFASLIEKLKNN